MSITSRDIANLRLKMIATTVVPSPDPFYEVFRPVIGELLAMADAFAKLKKICANQANPNVLGELNFIVNRSREVIAAFDELLAASQ